jgi:Helix-turn-helix domain
VLGFGNSRPLKPEMKNRLTAEARRMTRPTEPRMHYGQITAKQLEVFRALLWKFHNCVTGWCFPSYERIAEEAGCHRDTVHQAIAALEEAVLLTWDHRIQRRHHRVLRTSNCYRFKVPSHLQVSKSEMIPREIRGSRRSAVPGNALFSRSRSERRFELQTALGPPEGCDGWRDRKDRLSGELAIEMASARSSTTLLAHDPRRVDQRLHAAAFAASLIERK